MILRFLAWLFPQVQVLQSEVARHERTLAEMRGELEWAKREAAIWEKSTNQLNERCDRQQERMEVLHERAEDRLATAGDSLSLKLTGRRMFSKAPVEAPPEPKEHGPINLSAGSGKRFMPDVQREMNQKVLQRIQKNLENNRQAFQDLAQQAGVIPETKPN